jgi:5-methylcytosine-specific restriction endonuclease McrA
MRQRNPITWRKSDYVQARAPRKRDEQMKHDEDMRKFAGSTFLKIEDFGDDPRDTEIIDIQNGKFDRPVAEFADGTKLSLNTTNCKTLCRDLGPLRSDWLRHPLQLYKGETTYDGKTQPSVLIRVINPVPKNKQTPPPTPTSPMDDEIPF